MRCYPIEPMDLANMRQNGVRFLPQKHSGFGVARPTEYRPVRTDQDRQISGLHA
jgi:hypothetical protein